jgi:hypothetical protein
MDLLLHDLRFAFRGFLRRPGFTAVAVGALALGIGANVAIFSVFHAVMLRPLPFDDPERLVLLWEENDERDWRQAQVAAANFLDWREQAEGFAGMAGWNDWIEEGSVMVDGEPTMLRASQVTGTLFEVLGVAPALGPGFRDEHTWEAAGRATVLSDGLWRRLYGGDPGVIGRDLDLDGVPHRIVGVMPPGLDFPLRDAELWVNVAWARELRGEVWFRRAHGMRVIGRLAAVVGVATWRTLAPFTRSDHRATIAVLGGRTHAALEREKTLTLRAIKDLEFDRAMGKISEKDFAEMSGRLRARATRLLGQLDAGSSYRDQIEREVARRIGSTPDEHAPAASDPANIARACGACGKDSDLDARFCKHCGSSLEPGR